MNGTVWTNTRGTHTATTMANGHITPCYHNHRNHYKVRQSIYIVTMHKIVKLKQISSNKIAYRFWACSKLKEKKRESDWVKCQIICVERRDCFASFFLLSFFFVCRPNVFCLFLQCVSSFTGYMVDRWYMHTSSIEHKGLFRYIQRIFNERFTLKSSFTCECVLGIEGSVSISIKLWRCLVFVCRWNILYHAIIKRIDSLKSKICTR